METFIVTGIDNGKRFAGTFEAYDSDGAEYKAREVVGHELLVSAVIGPDGTVTTASYSPDIGPGTAAWKAATGKLFFDPNIPPVVGQCIYVPYGEGGHHSCPDAMAGIATVTSVAKMAEAGPNKDAWGIKVKEHPSRTMNWKYLASEQHKLREHYRYRRARMG